MSAKGVIVSDAAPVHVDAHRSRRARSDTVAPIILIRKTSPRPAHYRYMDLLERVDDILAIAVDVGDIAVLTYPDTLINPPPQVFGELAVDIAIDLRAGFRCVNRHRNRHRARSGHSRGGERNQQHRAHH